MLDNTDLHKQERGQYLRYLRKLCSSFGILPSSFMLPPASIEHDTRPFAFGDCSIVYKVTFVNRPVVVKVLNVFAQTDRERLHRVGSLGSKTSKLSLTLYPQLLVKEVVGWKWLRHENILPFVGVMPAPSPISIVSEQMENGNIMDFIKANRDYNRLRLVSGRSYSTLLPH